MAVVAALRHAARRLASQRPPALMHRAAVAEQPLRRLLHGGSSSAAGRTFALAEEQRRLLMAGRACSRTFSSHRNGVSYPMTFGEKAKKAIDAQVYDRVTLRLLRASVLFLKLTLFGTFVLDLCGPRYIPWFIRVVLGFEPLEERQFPRHGKEGNQSESS